MLKIISALVLACLSSNVNATDSDLEVKSTTVLKQIPAPSLENTSNEPTTKRIPPRCIKMLPKEPPRAARKPPSKSS